MEDLIFQFSYCLNAGYIPEIYDKLTYIIMEFRNNGVYHRDKELTRHLINMFVKLGFMFLARDMINKINGRYTQPDIRIYVEYHLYNFIYASKSLLDAIAMTINYVYKLGLGGRFVDLNEHLFLERLQGIQTPLSVEQKIRNTRGWISDVVKWRKELIHRCVTPVVHYGDPDQTLDYTIKMPLEPVPILDYTRISELKGRYNKPPFMEIAPFCDNWISNAKLLIETLGDDLLLRYGKNGQK